MTTTNHDTVAHRLLRPTLPVSPATGEVLGLIRWATYDAVKRGDTPFTRIPGWVLVATPALRRVVCVDLLPTADLDGVGARS
jgi:hypothetical protein